MTALAEGVSRWLIFSEENCKGLLILLFTRVHVVNAFAVDVMIGHVLPAECAYKLILFELGCIAINELGPLVHLMPCLLIELLLVEVVFLLELL